MPDPTPAPAPTPETPVPSPTPAPTPAPAPAPTPSPTPSPAPTPPAPSATPEPTSWAPPDWREKLAKGDEKRLGIFKRYNSPEAVGEALVAAQQRISSGEVRAPLPANPTPEQLASYRTEHGIPEKPEGYLANLPNGLVIGEDDRVVVTDFATALHAKNVAPEAVHAAIDWYNRHSEAQVAVIAEHDAAVLKQTEDALRAEWGGEYRLTTNALTNFLGSTVADESLRASIQGAVDRTPGFATWLANIARQERPEFFTTIVPAGAPINAQSIDTRIGEIETMMRKDRRAYNANEKVQAEYRGLLDAREQMKRRGVAA